MSTRSTQGRRARMATTGRFVKPHEPMTQEQLDEIQARVDAVGPIQPARHGTAPYEVYDSTENDSGKMGGYMTHGSPREADAEFITHAYTDVPALLAEVERLRALTTPDQRGAYGYDGAPIQGRFTALQLAEMEDE